MITFDEFVVFIKKTGVKHEKEFYELCKRKIVPINLVPESPATYYLNIGARSFAARDRVKKIFKEEHGVEYNWKTKGHKQKYDKIYRLQPEVNAKHKATKKIYREAHRQEISLINKKYREGQKYKAGHKKYMREWHAKRKANR